jgi:TonB-linked SusC/RagA family outer membrane protein
MLHSSQVPGALHFLINQQTLTNYCMKKTIQTIVLAALCLNFTSKVQAQEPARSTALKSSYTGKVISASTSEALPGAIVKITNTNQTLITNDRGEFTLNITNGNYNLSINYLSYKAKTLSVQIPLKELLTIALDTDEQNLQEVEINAGYYTIKEKERTGSISRVRGETIAKQPVSNPLAALIGRMPGVNIEQKNGINGGGFTVEIRGRNSLRATSNANSPIQPLYLIDGVPYPAAPVGTIYLGTSSSPFNYINPTDIESIEVLKDADATAIYGSRGANGVVLIKTKKAKRGTTVFEVNSFAGFSKVSTRLGLLNTQQYLEIRDEAFKNDGVAPGALDYDVNGTWDRNKYTDWQKTMIGGTASLLNTSASLSGGSENTQFIFRGNYSRQTDVFPGEFAENRGAGFLNIDHQSTNQKLKLNVSGAYSKTINNLPPADLISTILLPPNAPDPYNTDGSLNWALNPLGAATWTNPLNFIYQPYINTGLNFVSNALLNYELIPGLFIRSSLGYTNIRVRESQLASIKSQAPSPSTTGTNSLATNSIETWIVEPQINYRKQFGSGKLDILVGTTFQKDDQKAESLTGIGYTSDLLLEDMGSASQTFAGTSVSQYKYNAIFGRINYNYADKYLVNLTGRRDGSSRFGPDKQFANFGAIGLAWVFSNESFVKRALPMVSFGKFRASYGITGSDQIPNYGYLESYSASQPYQDGSGLIPSRIANNDYSWEANKKMELAVDLGFFNDRVMFTGGWYRNRSSNQLVGYTLPDIAGFSSVQYNLPATVQNTGWEFELNTSNITLPAFSWRTSINLTIPKNKLVSYLNIQGSTYANTYTVGESLFTPRTYTYLGVDAQTGVYNYLDWDQNSVFNNADRTSAAKPLTSHLFGGVLNSFGYKQFSVDAFFQFVTKTVRYPLNSSMPGTRGNKYLDVIERWQSIGEVSDSQKFSQASSSVANQRFALLFNSDRFTDASFIRLKNVSISWNATSLLKSSKVRGLRIYAQGQNLFTITDFLSDPEVGTVSSLPTLATFTAGLQLSL